MRPDLPACVSPIRRARGTAGGGGCRRVSAGSKRSRGGAAEGGLRTAGDVALRAAARRRDRGAMRDVLIESDRQGRTEHFPGRWPHFGGRGRARSDGSRSSGTTEGAFDGLATPLDRHRPGSPAAIQYAAASPNNNGRLWNTGSPAFAGGDEEGCIETENAISRTPKPRSNAQSPFHPHALSRSPHVLPARGATTCTGSLFLENRNSDRRGNGEAMIGSPEARAVAVDVCPPTIGQPWLAACTPPIDACGRSPVPWQARRNPSPRPSTFPVGDGQLPVRVRLLPPARARR